MNNLINDFKIYMGNQTTSAHSVKCRVSDVNIFFRHFKRLNHNTAQQFVSMQLKDDVNPLSIKRRIGSLKKYAKFIGVNIGDIDMPRAIRRLPKNIMTEKEMISLYEEAERITRKDGIDAMTLRSLIVLLNQTPRKSEILDIMDKDIDLGDEVIKMIVKRGKELMKPIYIGTHLLKDYIEFKRELGIEIPNFLVRKYNGKWKGLKEREMYSMLGGFTERVIGKKINPHAFRHSVATSLLNKGTDIRVIQEVLGHESLSSTQIYTHVALDKMRSSVKKNHPLM